MVSAEFSSLLPTKPAIISRRLLSITTALRLCGFREPDAEQLVLLSRYVAGTVGLREVLPALTCS